MGRTCSVERTDNGESFHGGAKKGGAIPSTAAASNRDNAADTTLTGGTTYVYRIKSRNARGDSPWSNEVSVTTPTSSTLQEAYLGAPTLPSDTVQAENYDVGGEGVSWNDSGGNAGQLYRSGSMDVVRGENRTGHAIEITEQTEWIEYTVDVAAAGSYRLDMRVASRGQGGTFHVESGGVDKTGLVTVPDTGSYYTFTTVSKDVTLSAGTQVLRFFMEAEGANGRIGHVDRFSLVASSAPVGPAAPSGVTATALSEQHFGLTWVDNSNNETGFTVQASLNGAAFNTVGTAAAGATNTVIPGLTPGGSYRFQVIATGSSANSTPSAATPAATTALAYVVGDTVTVPVTSSTPVMTNITLANGVKYKVRASGMAMYGGAGDGRVDAEYGNFQLNPLQDYSPAAGALDYGLGVDDTTLDGSKNPRWGAYRSDHVYTAEVTGRGVAVPVNFHDDVYTDNSGSLTLEVQLPTVRVWATDRDAAEAGPNVGQFTVYRTGDLTQSLVVNYTVGGTATSGSDYTALSGTVTIPVNAVSAAFGVTPVDNTTAEPDETVVVTVQPTLAYAARTPQSATVTIRDNDSAARTADLDRFEDTNQDGVHDNSASAEQAEASGPTTLPLASANQPAALALTLAGVASGETVTFEFNSAELRLYRDAAGTQPIAANTALAISTFGLSGPGTATLFAAAVAAGPLGGGLSVRLGGAAGPVFAAFTGGMTGEGGAEGSDTPGSGTGVSGGGLQDADGSQPLTDRDNFWQNFTGDTLIIGFSGHTQSAGMNGGEGPIWDIGPTTGTYMLGKQIRAAGYQITLFPEDPGNNNVGVLDRCGDGVLGRESGGVRTGGALAFVEDAVLTKGVKKLGLFGYSHGGGSVEILTDALARRASANPDLADLLVPGADGKSVVTIFWTSYTDAVDIDLNNDHTDAVGKTDPESQFPIHGLGGEGDTRVIGTRWHHNIYQDSANIIEREGGPLSEPGWVDSGRPAEHLRQVFTDDDGVDAVERPGRAAIDWGDRGLDHTDENSRGIAEDTDVRMLILESLTDARNALG